MFRSFAGIVFFMAVFLVVDWAVKRMNVPLPSAVIAMALLSLGMFAQKRVPVTLEAGAALLFRVFPLFIIPLLVSIVEVREQVLGHWVVLLLAVTVSTFLGLAVTGLLYKWLSRQSGSVE